MSKTVRSKNSFLIINITSKKYKCQSDFFDTVILLVPGTNGIILFSDNVGNNKLHNIEFTDFCKEYPTVNLSMKKTGGIFHDRFIVLDYGTADERVFLCGASSKDAGARITSIVEDYGVSKYAPVIAMLLKNPTLILPQ